MADVGTGLLSPSTRLPAAVQQNLLGCVQHAGDLVLIPPGWWHQTYYPEPSFCAAGQYLDSFCRDRVFQHALDWASTGRRADEIDAGLSPQAQVDALLALLRKGPSVETGGKELGGARAGRQRIGRPG